MLSIMDFQRRSLTGPIMTTNEFDLALTRKARAIIKKHGIKWNPEELIVDDATADAVFAAAVDFLVEVGLYNTTTSRVITWTKEEVEELARGYRENPPTINFGRGKDEHTIKPRTKYDKWRPVLWGSANPCLEQDSYIPFIQAFAQEEIVQGFGVTGGIGALNGEVPKIGAPSEIYCAIWEAKNTREAVRRAGRPDISLGLIPTVTSPGATYAAIGPGLREPFNTMIGMHIMPEQKIDFDRFNAAVVAEVTGIEPWTSAMSLVGGMCGGPPGTAMGLTANYLAQLSYGHGRLGHLFANDMAGRMTNRESLWTYSAAYGAVERHIGLSKGSYNAELSAVNSIEEGICRGVALAIVTTACGAAYTWNAGSSPITCRIQGDVMTGIAGMEHAKVNTILQKLSNKLLEMEKDGNAKMQWQEQLFPTQYHVDTLKPKQSYIDASKRAVEILASCGVPISDRLVIS